MAGGARVGAGRPKGTPTVWTKQQTDRFRARIKTIQIIDRLQDHVFGRIEMEGSAVRAATSLLDKVLPNLQEIENTGEGITYVALLPMPVNDTKAWLESNAPRQLVDVTPSGGTNGKTSASESIEGHERIRSGQTSQRKQNGSEGHKP